MRKRGWLAAWWLLTLAPGLAVPEAEFAARSLALRTALHHDASVEAPFAELVALYEEAGRGAELRALYQTHLTQYPTDAGARAVLLRLGLAEDSADTVLQAREAVQRHPDEPYLLYLAYRATAELPFLSRAVGLETRGDRRRAWLRELVAASVSETEREEVVAALRSERERCLAQEPEFLAQLLAWMREGEFLELARETVAVADRVELSPEAELEFALVAARVEAPEAAGKRLTQLLQRLTPDHARRTELGRLRWELSADRGALLRQVQGESDSPARAVDLATLLEAEDRGVEAGQVYAEAALTFPHLSWLEERARALLSAEPERWRDYVRRRLALSPERPELRGEEVRLVFQLDGAEAGAGAVDKVSDGAALLSLAEPLLSAGFAAGAERAVRRAKELGVAGFEADAWLVRALAAQENGAGLAEAVRALPVRGVPGETWVRLAEFLQGEAFVEEARMLLERGLAEAPSDFAGMLALAKVSDPDRAERLLEEGRALARVEESYRDWLIAAAESAASRRDADGHWRREAARLASAPMDEALIRDVQTFVDVAEERSQMARGKAAAAALLDKAGAEIERFPELRRLAVRAFAGDAARVVEVERHLIALLEGGENSEDRLRLGLLYEGVRRTDLAREQRARVRWTEIDSAALLEEAIEVWPEAGLEIWRRWTELRPGDVAVWEARLNGLWAAREEGEFREVANRLMAAEGPLELSEPVREELTEWRFRSWQREVEEEWRAGREEVALRKARAGAAEAVTEAQRAWFRGVREGRRRASAKGSVPEVRPQPVTQLSWRFVLRGEGRVVAMAVAGDVVGVLDDRSRLWGLDAVSGKLRWERSVDTVAERGSGSPGAEVGEWGEVFVPPDLVSDGELILTGAGNRVVALAAETGATVWEARPGGVNRAMTPPRIGFGGGGSVVVMLFPGAGELMAVDRGTGKLRWRVELASGLRELPPVAVGFAVGEEAVAVFGERLELFEVASGERRWVRELSAPLRVSLREGGGGEREVGPRHVAFAGDAVLAMEAGVVWEFGTEHPGAGAVTPVAGMFLGGTGRWACFAAEDGVEVLELGNGTRRRLAGRGKGLAVVGDVVLRRSGAELSAWHASSGRKLWSVEVAGGPEVERGGLWWRGEIVPENWQGFVIRSSRSRLAVWMPGRMMWVGAGEREVEAWTR